MTTIAPVALSLLCVLVPTAWAVENPETTDDDRKLGYSIGYQVGGDLARQGLKVDPEMLIRGLLDALDGSEPLMTADEMKRALVKLQREATAAAEKPPEDRASPEPEPGAEPPDEE